MQVSCIACTILWAQLVIVVTPWYFHMKPARMIISVTHNQPHRVVMLWRKGDYNDRILTGFKELNVKYTYTLAPFRHSYIDALNADRDVKLPSLISVLNAVPTIWQVALPPLLSLPSLLTSDYRFCSLIELRLPIHSGSSICQHVHAARRGRVTYVIKMERSRTRSNV